MESDRIENMDTAPDLRHQLITCFLSCLGPLLFGFIIGFSSPAIPELEKSVSAGGMDLTVQQASWFSSVVTLGALVGGPLVGLLVDKFGRKLSIMLTTLPYSSGWFLLAYANNPGVLYTGRILTGIGTGMVSVVVPMYIAEISSKGVRGVTGTAFQLSLTFGTFLMYLIGLWLKYTWLSIIASIATSALLICMVFLPESPTWLIRNGKKKKAVETLFWLRGKQACVDMEYQKIQENMILQGNKIKIREVIKTKCLYKPIAVVLATMVFQQTSGINAVLFNANSIFQTAGFQTAAGIPSLILAVIQVIMTFVSCLIMDKAGRKLLLIISGSVMCLSCVTFSLYYVLEDNNILDPHKWYMKALSLGSLGIYISMYAIGWGPVPRLYMSEYLPSNVRGLGSALAQAVNWAVAFIVTRCFSTLQIAIKPYGVFCLFACSNLFSVIFVAVFLFETKGKSLEEIEKHIYGKHSDYELIDGENDVDDPHSVKVKPKISI